MHGYGAYRHGIFLSSTFIVIFKHEKCCGIKQAIIEVRVVMLGGYSVKFSRRQCKIQLPRDNLREQKVLEGAFFRLQRA